MTKWNKLCKEIEKIQVDISNPSKHVPLFLELWKQVKAEGDKREKDLIFWQEACAEMQIYKNGLYDKLEAIRGIIKIPEVWTHPDPIQAIREVLDKSAQNTDYVQKEEN